MNVTEEVAERRQRHEGAEIGCLFVIAAAAIRLAARRVVHVRQRHSPSFGPSLGYMRVRSEGLGY